MVSKSALLLAWVALGSHAQIRDTLPNLRSQSESLPATTETELVDLAGFPAKQVRYALINENTGGVVRVALGDVPSIPASVTKLPTALRAFDRLGPNARLTTRVWTDDDGRIYLQGGGDVSFDAAGLRALALATSRVATASPRAFVFDDTLFERRSLISPVFDPLGEDNAGIGALPLHGNVYTVRVKKTDNSFVILTDGQTGSLRVVRDENARASDDAAYRDKQANSDLWRLNAAYVENLLDTHAVGDEVVVTALPMRDPGLVVAELFREAMSKEGVSLPAPVRGALPTNAHIIAEQASAEIPALLRHMLEVSDNVYAESFGLLAESLQTAHPTQGQAAKGLAAWMKALAPEVLWDGFELANSSGLTTGNLVSPLQMTGFLRTAHSRQNLLPVFGLLNRSEKSGAVLQAKTGSLNYVRALAGTLQTAHGTPLILAIFINDPERRAILDRGPVDPRYRDASNQADDWNARSRALRDDLVNLWSRDL